MNEAPTWHGARSGHLPCRRRARPACYVEVISPVSGSTSSSRTSSRLVDFDREQVDAAIRSGPGPYPDLHADFLFDDELTPLCSPALARKMRKPADVLGFMLLDDHNF
ncbi:MAG: hypothetical protein ING29_14910, partial [Azospirillum sp.]|nr:hypothetical protein [Azospirillum sp.]